MVRRPGGIFGRKRTDLKFDGHGDDCFGRSDKDFGFDDAVMKVSEADAILSEECISHGSDAKNLERSKTCEGSLAHEKRMTKGRLQNCKAQETQQQQQQQPQPLCPPTFTKTVLAGSLAASHSSGISISLEFMEDHGHRIRNEAVLQDEYGMTWEVSVSRGSWSGFRAGWKKFADNHAMAVGDKIEFTLVAYSVFAVRIISERQPLSHIRRFCEDSHATAGYKGISRKRSARHVSSTLNKRSCGSGGIEDEAESNNHQLCTGIVTGTSSNPCKRARSKRSHNYKRDSKEVPQSEKGGKFDNSKLSWPSSTKSFCSFT